MTSYSGLKILLDRILRMEKVKNGLSLKFPLEFVARTQNA
jgi:hypothetical protein